MHFFMFPKKLFFSFIFTTIFLFVSLNSFFRNHIENDHSESTYRIEVESGPRDVKLTLDILGSKMYTKKILSLTYGT